MTLELAAAGATTVEIGLDAPPTRCIRLAKYFSISSASPSMSAVSRISAGDARTAGVGVSLVGGIAGGIVGAPGRASCAQGTVIGFELLMIETIRIPVSNATGHG